jgi:hypothetical protein
MIRIIPPVNKTEKIGYLKQDMNERSVRRRKSRNYNYRKETMNENVRAFYRSDKAYYADANRIKLPEINFGLYDKDGGCVAEITAVWMELGNDLVPQIQIFDDAWEVFAEMKDLIDELAKYNRKAISDDKFAEILLSLGFKDRTEYEIPKKYQIPKNKINFINTSYKPLFSIDDGDEIEIEVDGVWIPRTCVYIDEYHFKIVGDLVYHTYQFAEIREFNKQSFRPKAKQ